MAGVYLSLYRDLSAQPSDYRVRLNGEDPFNNLAGGLVLCALSPLFPSAKLPFLPSKGDTYEITFIVHRKPYTQIGQLDEVARSFVWYSLGLASLVLITPEKNTCDDVLGKMRQDEILCRESLSVRDGMASGMSRFFIPTGKATPGVIVVPKLPQDIDLHRIVRELYLNFDTLKKRAHVLMPSLLPTLDRVMAEAQTRIAQLEARESYLRKHSQHKPSITVFEKGRQLLLKQINLSIDTLIQLNSALAYVISQSFYGGPPILAHPSLIGCHSLLGVGTAIQAIQSLTEFIVEAFAKHPLALVAKTNYGKTLLIEHFATGSTAPVTRTIDFYSGGIGPRRQRPKLAYFSTRMGFSEHDCCVTAASQCWASADSVRRNLLTLSHELLHSHVKGLFAILLTGIMDMEPDDDRLIGLVKEYRELGRAVAKSNSFPETVTLLQFLRFRIFLFCDGMHKLVSEYPGCQLNRTAGTTSGVGPDKDDHAELVRFKDSFGFLNELVVHILDFHYFYDRSEHIYLATLWKSWATIPGVADKIEWYVLRSLVAVSVGKMNGMSKTDFPTLPGDAPKSDRSIDDRFDAARNSLSTILEELCAQSDCPPMLFVVSAKLKDKLTIEWLRNAFIPSHLFAQIVKQFLYSAALKFHFDSFEDPLADRDESNEPIYRLEALEFQKGCVRNPIALLRDRLRHHIENSGEENEEARSAWLFLALASVPSNQ